MPKDKILYKCQVCEFESIKWLGRCPECKSWGTLEENQTVKVDKKFNLRLVSTSIKPITDIDFTTSQAIPTKISELDRVLGSGIVPGSVILLAGEPGVGKSTLLLKVAKSWADNNEKALYVTGEESAGQVRIRAERTYSLSKNLLVSTETSIEQLLNDIDEIKPTLVVIDSIQTIKDPNGESSLGISHIKSVTNALVSIAKNRTIAFIIIGHVTKEGNVAGPKTLEHLVDVVITFEGDKHTELRILRGIKNRFGATNEIGCFIQTDIGIQEVANPANVFVRNEQNASGTALTVSMEGNRALMAEIQALIIPSQAPAPKRIVHGLDSSRLAMLLAVLERRCGIKLSTKEVYAATVGGLKISEPTADLAIAMAVASVAFDKPIDNGIVFCGEIGLAGEIRATTNIERRIKEANRLGAKQIFVPHTQPINDTNLKKSNLKTTILPVKNLRDCLTKIF